MLGFLKRSKQLTPNNRNNISESKEKFQSSVPIITQQDKKAENIRNQVVSNIDSLNLELDVIKKVNRFITSQYDKYVLFLDYKGVMLIVFSVSNDMNNKFLLEIYEQALNNKRNIHDKEVKVLSVSLNVFEILKKNAVKNTDRSAGFTDAQTYMMNILEKGEAMGATDIHITCDIKNGGRIQYRVHKALIEDEITRSYRETKEAVSSIYNTEAFGQSTTSFSATALQQAQGEISLNGNNYEFRYQDISHVPIDSEGSDVSFTSVFRLLPRSMNKDVKLSDLGYTEEEYDTIIKMLLYGSGAIIIGGSMNSGKSTSLNALMTYLIKQNKKKGRLSRFVSIEDPVEYITDGVLQISANSTSDMSEIDISTRYNEILRSCYRSDVNHLKIGEVRDKVTAKALKDFSDSGHKVYSTTHASSVFKIFDRLHTNGLDRMEITSEGFIAGLIAQNLVPKLCDKCKIPYSNIEEYIYKDKNGDDHKILEDRSNIISMRELKESLECLGLDVEEELNKIYFTNFTGCDSCNKGTTYQTLVVEMMIPDLNLLSYISQGREKEAIKYWIEEMNGKPKSVRTIETILTGDIDPLALSEVNVSLSDEKLLIYGKNKMNKAKNVV